jgi:hypothetical protein
MKVGDWLTKLHRYHLSQFENQAHHLLKTFETYGLERLECMKEEDMLG